MRRILVVVLVLFFIQTMNAQVDVPTQDRPKELPRTVYGLGAFGGLVGGIGLSFRHHLPTPFSYQVTAGIIKVDSKTHYDVGAEAQYDLVRGESMRFYACGGLGYFYSGTDGNELDGPFRLGAGVGIEQSRVEGFSFSVELLFTYFSNGTVLPLPQAGVHYYFY